MGFAFNQMTGDFRVKFHTPIYRRLSVGWAVRSREFACQQHLREWILAAAPAATVSTGWPHDGIAR